jgi:hypothetical protein
MGPVGAESEEAGAAPAAPPTSLVPMDQTVHEITGPEAWKLCPRINHDRQFWVNIFTGEKRPDSCRANSCEVCIGPNARKKAAILSWAQPERYAVLSQAPTDWDVCRQKMRNLPRLLKRRGYRWDQGWTIEINPRGTGHHVNVLQKGDYVPQKVLQEVWGSIVHIQAVRTPPAALAGYVLKEAAIVSGYVLKDAQTGVHVMDHLAANGGRLAHVSRGYFPLNPETDKPYTQREVAQSISGEGDQAWRLVLS